MKIMWSMFLLALWPTAIYGKPDYNYAVHAFYSTLIVSLWSRYKIVHLYYAFTTLFWSTTVNLIWHFCALSVYSYY